VREREVTMKMIAAAVVSLVRKLPAPVLPKTVELEPPKTAPMSAPFPVWRRTTRTRKMHARTWMIVMMVAIVIPPRDRD
jgi:hypothetical protein